MGRNYEQLFALPAEQVPAYLCEQICRVLAQERLRRERVRLVVSSLCGTSSLVGLVLALPALFRAADSTGFSRYLSLSFSDGSILLTHLDTFGASLLEALPGVEVTVTLFLLAVFLVSLKNFVRSIVSLPSRHALA